MKPAVVLSILWAVLLAATGSAQAAPLNLTPTYPDFYVTGLSYSYNAGTGLLTVGQTETISATGGNDDGLCNAGETCTGTGAVGSYSAGAPPSPQLQVTNHPTITAYKELFSLYVDLDGSGNVQSGSFRVDGVVRTSGFPGGGCTLTTCIQYDGSTNAGGLLSGTVTQFGWSTDATSNGVIEFKFNNGGGVIGGLGYNAGGMILTVSSSSLSNFGAQALTTSWTGTGLGDVYVPVPAAVWLFSSGLLALLGVARRKAK